MISQRVAVLSCVLASAAASASAQVTQVPVQMGNLGLGGMAGAATVGTAFNAQTPGAMTSFNDPRFFVLQGMSTQLDALTPKVSDPKAVVAGVAAMLSSPKVLSAPNSPQGVAARVIAAVVADPMKGPALGPTLRSLNPAMGSSVMAKLEELTQAASDPETATERAGLLQRLASVERKIAASRGKDGALVDGVAGRLALDELFLGGNKTDGSGEPSAGGAAGWGTQDGLKTESVVLAEGASGKTLPEAWRLRPSKSKGVSVDGFTPAKPEVGWTARERETTVRVDDLAATVEGLREASLGEAGPVRDADGTVLPAAFLIRREPRLLRLLRIGEGESSASRTLTDGRRSLEVVIVVDGGVSAASYGQTVQQTAAPTLSADGSETTLDEGDKDDSSSAALDAAATSSTLGAAFSGFASSEAPAGALWLGWLAALLASMTWLERSRFSLRRS